MRGSDWEDYLLLFVNLVKESPCTDPKSPGLGLKAFELLDTGAIVWMLSQVRIYDLTELSGYPGFPRPEKPPQIFLELLGLEDSVFSQRSGLSWTSRHETLP